MRYLLLLLCAAELHSASVQEYQTVEVEDKDFWLSASSVKLDSVLKRRQKNSVAKNVIVFVGDGMGVSTVTAGRIYRGQRNQQPGESYVLSFEKFPVTGLSKTYSLTNQVSDSASTGTAMFTGVKIRQGVLGLDSLASYDSCIPEMNQKAAVTSMMTWAQEIGKDTGIVTTTRITHATPAATYAQVNNRDWECDSSIPRHDVDCVKDIARQLVENSPGKNLKVILGGGRNQLGDGFSPSSEAHCTRSDGRNLATEWTSSRKNSLYVTTADELSKVNIRKTDYLLGLFADSHLPYVAERSPTRPSLKKMTETAIRMLEKNPEGYVLMVEGGRIDHAHHNNTPGLALSELVDLDEAVEAAYDMTDPDETLIIVTADHSHTLTLNGYPDRGNNILGLAENQSNSFYETLTYATGPGFKDHHLETPEGNCHGSCPPGVNESANTWTDLRRLSNAEDVFRRHMSSVYLKDASHGGEDVAIYASGPMSHLLVGVHEQNYIATVISYAACMGPEARRCARHGRLTSSAPEAASAALAIVIGLTAILGL